MQIYRTATSFKEMGTTAARHTRIPAGHPEGFIEAFANVYRNFAFHIAAVQSGTSQDTIFDYPGINEGVRSMKFLEAAVASASEKSFWKNL